MDKQTLVKAGILTNNEVIEYEELLIALKFFNAVNEQINIEIGTVDAVTVKPVRGYCYDKRSGKWVVKRRIKGKDIYYGDFESMYDAVAKAKQVQDEDS